MNKHAFGATPYANSFANKRPWGIQSNALERSMPIVPTLCHRSEKTRIIINSQVPDNMTSTINNSAINRGWILKCVDVCFQKLPAYNDELSRSIFKETTLYHVQLSGTETEISRHIKWALHVWRVVPCVASCSATMPVTVWWPVSVKHEDGCQWPLLYQCRNIIEHVDIFLCSLQQITTRRQDDQWARNVIKFYEYASISSWFISCAYHTCGINVMTLMSHVW